MSDNAPHSQAAVSSVESQETRGDGATASSTPEQGYLSTLLQLVESRNKMQPEFAQAVHEVYTDVFPYLASNPKLLKACVDAKIMQRLTEPERMVTFRVAWVDEKGVVQVNRGFRCQMSSLLGPYKGGLRFHPSVNESVVKFLAYEQSFKNALTTIPMGGAKGGSDFNPKGKSDRDIMCFCQAFMSELYRHIGSETDVPAGDIGVGAREVGFMFGQYKRLTNQWTGVLTGKSPSNGGSNMRSEATGYGIVYFLQAMLSDTDKKLEGQVVAVSGAGNVALHTIEKLVELGATVVSASDSSGFVHDPDGITKEKLRYLQALKQKNRNARVSEYAENFPGATFYPSDGDNATTLWQKVQCDIAIPCATQNELAQNDAKALVENGCSMVVEGANMPLTAGAVSHLRAAHIPVAPSKAANAGGVAVSGLEMSQNRGAHPSRTMQEVNSSLKEIMIAIHRECRTFAQAECDSAEGEECDRGYIDYIRGANIASFLKLSSAMLSQGIM